MFSDHAEVFQRRKWQTKSGAKEVKAKLVKRNLQAQRASSFVFVVVLFFFAYHLAQFLQ